MKNQKASAHEHESRAHGVAQSQEVRNQQKRENKNANTGEPDQHLDDSKDKTVWERWKKLTIGNQLIAAATVVISLANIVYAGIAGWQLIEIHHSTTIAHDTLIQMQMQQRPYV